MEKKPEKIIQEGYLVENYRYFHLHDTAGQERNFHFHSFDKIVILISGKVDYIVEDVTYALQPWSVLLVRHHAIHKAVIDKSEPYDRIIIYLDHDYFLHLMPGSGMMECFVARDGEEKCYLLPEENDVSELRNVLESFEQTEKDQRFGAEVLREIDIMRILTHISRIAKQKEGLAEETAIVSDPKIAQSVSYIEEHLKTSLSVDLLAGNVFLSKYHFMRLFKEQTGSTVHAYIREKRLLMAARMIREGVPAVQAAQESGFSDYSTFSRAFRSSFNIRPSEIKK